MVGLEGRPVLLEPLEVLQAEQPVPLVGVEQGVLRVESVGLRVLLEPVELPPVEDEPQLLQVLHQIGRS